MEFWRLRREKKIRDMQNEMLQKEFESGMFKPKISHKSLRIVNKVRQSNSPADLLKPKTKCLVSYRSS